MGIHRRQLHCQEGSASVVMKVTADVMRMILHGGMLNVCEQLADKDDAGMLNMCEQLADKDDAGMLNMCEQLADKDGMLNMCEQLADEDELCGQVVLRSSRP
jgi:hypothetical protein